MLLVFTLFAAVPVNSYAVTNKIGGGWSLEIWEASQLIVKNNASPIYIESMLKLAVASTIGIQSWPQTCVSSVVHVERKFILVTERKVSVHLSIMAGNITKFQAFRIVTMFYVPGCLSGQ